MKIEDHRVLYESHNYTNWERFKIWLSTACGAVLQSPPKTGVKTRVVWPNDPEFKDAFEIVSYENVRGFFKRNPATERYEYVSESKHND